VERPDVIVPQLVEAGLKPRCREERAGVRGNAASNCIVTAKKPFLARREGSQSELLTDTLNRAPATRAIDKVVQN